MIDIITSLWIALAVILTLFILVPSKLEISRRVLLMLVLAGIGVLSYRSINSRAGLPVPMPILDKEVLFISYFPDQESGKIYVWLQIQEGTTPKTYVFKYSDESAKKLKGLRTKNKGKPVVIKLTTKRKSKITDRLKDQHIEIQVDDGVRLPPK